MTRRSLPSRLLLGIARKAPKNSLGDKLSALIIFFVHQKRLPDFRNGGLNDACYYVKATEEILHPGRVFTSDKEYLKFYVTAKVGKQHTVPTLAVLHSISEVKKYQFDANSVIKPTHMSGEVIFYNHTEDLDMARVRNWFSVNYYNWTRERNYKYLIPKVIVEPVIFPGERCDDYKVFCLNGRPKFIKVEIDRNGDHQQALYTPDWQRMPASFSTNRSKPYSLEIAEPENLSTILAIAQELSRDFNFIRVDCYTNGKTVYVGELTNVPGDTRSVFGSRDEEEIVTAILFSEGGIKRELIDQNNQPSTEIKENA